MNFGVVDGDDDCGRLDVGKVGDERGERGGIIVLAMNWFQAIDSLRAPGKKAQKGNDANDGHQ